LFGLFAAIFFASKAGKKKISAFIPHLSRYFGSPSAENLFSAFTKVEIDSKIEAER
jgi:predicted protein tyrosine phosphatase